MRLQKRLSRKYKDKEYYKYLLVIPNEEIKKSGFKEGDNLKIETKKGKIKIKK
ncbi:MAG: hypothetical protein KKF67_02475 [Nanoarchaeota archaeon]|nr:hypothetical protein [Nanoarchaeota archaeon]